MKQIVMVLLNLIIVHMMKVIEIITHNIKVIEGITIVKLNNNEI